MLGLAALPGSCRAPGTDLMTMDRVILAAVSQYPAMQPVDLYKLVYQAALGGAHMGMDSAMADAWLTGELAGLAPGGAERLVDTIAPGGAVVRINLRPFRASGGASGALASAFARSAREFKGSRERLAEYWTTAEGLAAAGRLPYDPDSLRALWVTAVAAGFPEPHHTEAYTAAYRPAYRVITGAVCRARGWCAAAGR